jgi:hypothetical protein
MTEKSDIFRDAYTVYNSELAHHHIYAKPSNGRTRTNT